MFMCKGQCVYHGGNKDVVPYFSTLGYQCETHENPTDFVLDILIDAARTPETLARLIDTYRESTLHTDLVALAESENILSNIENPARLQRKIEVEAAQSLGTEIFYVSQRTLRNALRNPAMALAQVVVSIMIGFLVGLVFYDLKKTTDPGVQNRLGAIFFIVVNQVFSTMTAIEPLLQERALFLHVTASYITKIIDIFFIFQEYASGYYRIRTFFIAKLMCDLLPLRAIPSILFSIIAYFMTGLTRTGGQFFIFLITIFMASVFGAAVCFFLSTLVTTFGKISI
jgi:ATP-binding cassette subfamily G (WHITE) protein 2